MQLLHNPRRKTLDRDANVQLCAGNAVAEQADQQDFGL
jgi:hypothetical protein